MSCLSTCNDLLMYSQVAKYLRGPLAFHNNPPSTIRPRHRNRHVISQIMVDQHGQEHMIITFYVQGRPLGSEIPESQLSYFEKLTESLREKASTISHLTLEESISWTRECAGDLWNKTKILFKYLSGSPLPPLSLPSPPPNAKEGRKGEDTGAWNFAGIFSSLKGPNSSQSHSKQWADSRIFTDGQVHAHLVRVSPITKAFSKLLYRYPSSLPGSGGVLRFPVLVD